MNLSPNFPSLLNILNLTGGRKKCGLLLKSQKAPLTLQIQIKWGEGGGDLPRQLRKCPSQSPHFQPLPHCCQKYLPKHTSAIPEPYCKFVNSPSLPTEQSPNPSELLQESSRSGLSLLIQLPFPTESCTTSRPT